MAVPPRRHCSASEGAGLPLQLPGSTLTAAPTLPVPLSFGWEMTAGATPRTLTLKPAEALPPELLAVTVTLAPVTSASVGMATLPVAGSMLAPAPSTA